MDYYEIWCDLKETRRDLEFCEAVNAWLGALKKEGLIEGHSIKRRKLGFGPPELGEFNITILTQSLAQLEDAFQRVAEWTPDLHKLHAAVYSSVTNVKFGLTRDFPDPIRLKAKESQPKD